MSVKGPKLLFSDFFQIPKSDLDNYGAFDVSLVADLPLFIDPFLLFNSKKNEYRKLHDEIIKYLRFLKTKSVTQELDEGLIKAWFCFGEVKQNWLGFSNSGNQGRGLGEDFANALNNNLNSVFSNFSSERVTRGSHLEKLCLIKEGVGRDSISDFTTNLIKEYLLIYTQTFAKKYIKPEKCEFFNVDKVCFNYETESWENKSFFLPFFMGEFVILTPKNLLTKDENWINREDLIRNFSMIPNAIPNASLRGQINNYFFKILPQKATKKEEKEAVYKTINKYPILIDFFIKSKEDHGESANIISADKVRYSENLYIDQFGGLASLLWQHTNFYGLIGDTYQEAKQRALYLKRIIEKNDGYRLLYVDGEPLKKEEDLKILYRLTWFGTPSDVSKEVGDGRGVSDFKISRGAMDKTIVEFKLARNPQLKRNLKNQLEIYKEASDTKKGLSVIIYFSKKELERVLNILKDLKLTSSRDIILIDARKDNKSSASKA